VKPCALTVVAVVLLAAIVSAQELPKITTYFGMCDASGAVPVGPKMFLVANDEDNVLRIYRRDQGGLPVDTCDLTSFLKPEPLDKETDIEGATRIGDRIYWIASHGNRKDGKPDPNRHRFFATDLKISGESVTFEPVGTPYRKLLTDLIGAPALKGLQLGEAAAPSRAPEDRGGLNIEGLCKASTGSLLIAFRNPIPEGKALIVPLENPEDILQGKAAKIGAPIRLSLGGSGIRSIEYCDALGTYLILAGPYNDEGSFSLYTWSGAPSVEPTIVPNINFQDLHPEALIVYPGEKTVEILSDDGDKPIDGKKCKNVPPEKRSFRSIWVSLTQP
jgi:hypothetical protein